MNEHDEPHYRFSEAPIWEMLRTYYNELGPDAWRNDQVPQYITSNPMIAEAYAEMIFGFLLDRATLGDLEEPVVIAELGAGPGRLGFHILHRLERLVAESGMTLPPYRYILTDFSDKNITSWQRHPKLRPYCEQGVLDFARFDATLDRELYLLHSGEVISAGSLSQPVFVIANYFFDSIPQQLIYVDEGRIFECEISLGLPENHEAMKPGELLGKLAPAYHYRRAESYETPDYPYRETIRLYQEELEDSHILFPDTAIDCMERLGTLSRSGFLLLTADKGDHRLENWKFAAPPSLIHHGSVSFTANYHAMTHVFGQRGAQSFFTKHHYKNLNVGIIAMTERPQELRHIRLAYNRFIGRFGPDDFFSLKLLVDRQIGSMELQPFLAFWRLGCYDAEWFIQNAEQLSGLLPEAGDEELEDLRSGIYAMWSGYYEMPQPYDLALDAGLLLFEMERYADAEWFLGQSLEAESETPDITVLYCLAICRYEADDLESAIAYTRKALVLAPDHEEAQSLLAALTGEA